MLAAFFLAGCAAAGPDYRPPEVSAPGQWNAKPAGLAAEGGLDPAGLARWWSLLGDPTLTSLVERSVEGNLDLKSARARVRESRARLGISRAGLLPTLDASASARQSRGSENVGAGTERDFYSAGFDASWEVDLFGGIRRSVEAARADLGASEEDLRAVLVSLVAEVALEYLDLRTSQARLAIAESNLASQEETYGLVSAFYEAGLRTGLDLEQARYNLESTRAEVPALRASITASMNRLAVLLGVNPGSLQEELSAYATIPAAEAGMAVGIPADVLRQRPDVRRSERELAAQTARVGVAAADFYPKLTLAGSIGLESTSTGSLFSSGSKAYQFGPSLSWAVFHGGQIRSNIEVQGALQEQALAAYEASVLAALQEVEDALKAYAEELQTRQHLMVAVEAARNAAGLSQDLYFSGLSDFQGVLEAQRAVYSLEDRLAQSEGNVTTGLVRLYKALGGGWPPEGAAVETYEHGR